SRLGVPVTLVFLGIGMLAGSDGPGQIWFDRFDVTYLAGTSALVVILFAGGLNTQLGQMRRVLLPAGVLATGRGPGGAGLTALGAHSLLGQTWSEALLIGAIVSSTDAAAVFVLLDGVPLRRRVRQTLEAESGLNDPVAVILTVAATLYNAGLATLSWTLV